MRVLALVLPLFPTIVSGYGSFNFAIQVKDSATGSSISGALCALVDEGNSIVATSTSSGGGGCNLVAPSCSSGECPVHFKAVISKSGYYKTDRSGLQRGVDSSTQIQLTDLLSNTVDTSVLRVVLSWGDYHSDLDSHLIVPPQSSWGNPCFVYYGRQSCPSAELGEC